MIIKRQISGAAIASARTLAASFLSASIAAGLLNERERELIHSRIVYDTAQLTTANVSPY
eukprot:scaffold284190_cov33-Prasinocladus_malaysianus.AAC.1